LDAEKIKKIKKIKKINAQKKKIFFIFNFKNN